MLHCTNPKFHRSELPQEQGYSDYGRSTCIVLNGVKEDVHIMCLVSSERKQELKNRIQVKVKGRYRYKPKEKEEREV